MVDVRAPTSSRAPASLDAASANDVQATFCATLVDEWLRLGVSHAVVAPGSRSTPMALALADCDEMNVHVVHDERVAAFVALGIGLHGDPALLLCTSGTAAANFFPAVVEAGLSEVSMIVLTADRPQELRGVGAPQTIDQIELYGRHVRWFHDPGVPDAATSCDWRRLATTAQARSRTGPVQLNLAFREPLIGRSLDLPAAEDAIAAPPDADEAVASDPVPDGFDRERGVILVGGRSGVERNKILTLHTLTGWPIVADAQSEMRDFATVTTIDSLLRDQRFADDHIPDVVIRIGRPSTSKVLAQWSARGGVTLIQVGGPGRIDPAHNVSAVCTIDDLLATESTGASDSDWSEAWAHADRTASATIERVLDELSELSEPAVARIVVDAIAELADRSAEPDPTTTRSPVDEQAPVGGQRPASGHGPAGEGDSTLAPHGLTAMRPGLTVSSSMPVRDVEWFGGPNARAHANRGANGIDGVMSTAFGRALRHGGTEFVLIGDLAFVHDSNALVGLAGRNVDLRIVVVDNDGGGIFSFLPQATELPNERFEQLFGTPLRADVLGLARAHGIPTATATTKIELTDQMSRSGPWVCRVPSDRAQNVRIHHEIHAAVETALSAHASLIRRGQVRKSQA